MKYKVAVVGATGNVGRVMLNILAEKNFPVTDVVALASEQSVDKKVSYGDNILSVQLLSEYNFADTDIALFSAGSKIALEYAPIAAKNDCIVIDNSSYFRMDDDIPLVIPEVNLEALEQYSNRNIIANPNCAVLQMLTVLKPLHDYAQIKRIVVSTYQSVSGAGKKAMDELYNQTRSKFFNNDIPPVHFPKRISFNIIPQIDSFMDNGYTKEEWKVIKETQKILSPAIEVTATCVRVPVFTGHSESVNIEFCNPITAEQAHNLLMNAPCVSVVDDIHTNLYITPIESVGHNTVYVSRIRQDYSVQNALNMWIVSDNLRKGAALNAVQIAEQLIKNYI